MQSKPVADSFLEHDRYGFKVIVNPTRRESASRKLVPVKGREAIGSWFCERAPLSWGFRALPEYLEVTRVDVVRFKDKQQRLVTLAQAHVQGQLEVLDRALFRRSFARGIGRARTFGCGLLQIVPLLDNPFA